MSNLTHDIEISTAKHLSSFLNNVPISPFRSLSHLSTPLYSLVSSPMSIVLQDFRYIAEIGSEVSSKDITTLVERIHSFSSHFLAILQNNQQCRSSWFQISNRGTTPGFVRINTSELQSEQKTLKELTDECTFGVTCSEQFFELISLRAKDIFCWKDHSKITKSLRSIHIPQPPEYYDLTVPLTLQQYHRSYQKLTEQLSIIQTTTKNYLEGQLPFKELQPVCIKCSQQASPLVNRTQINEVIKYTLYYCDEKMRALKKLLEITNAMRTNLIRSVVRMFYIISNADQDIDNLHLSLNAVEERVCNWLSEGGNGRKSVNLQKGSRIGHGSTVNQDGASTVLVLNEEIAPQLTSVQTQFNIIFTYLTDRKETIFPQYYSYQLKRPSLKLQKLKDRTTHIQKLRFNPDYSQSFLSRQKNKTSNTPLMISQRIKQLQDMQNEFIPLDETHFRIIFQEIQRAITFIGKEKKNSDFRERVLRMEQEIINDFMFDQEGNRKWNKQTHCLARSRVISGPKKGKVIKGSFFQQNYDQIANRSSPNGKNRKQSETYDKNEVYRQATVYLGSIKAHFGQELLDQSHFKVYLLPRMIRKIQQILLLIPYTQQPLNHQLNRLLQNLRFIPSIIKPEINQQKIDLIFYPKIDSALFSAFKHNLIDYRNNLVQVGLKVKKDNSKVVEPQIKQFIDRRLKFLEVFIQNIDKLEELAFKVDQMYLAKETHDIAEEGTNNIVLTLLLAEKQIKAQLLSLQDVHIKDQSQKAISLLTKKILPLFNQSLSQVFEEHDQTQTNPKTLQNLLELCEAALKVMSESEQCMDSAINVLEDIRNGRNHRSWHDLVRSLSADLRTIRQRLEWVVTESRRYLNINAESVKRQMVRVEEFLQICQQGGRHTGDLIQQRSLYFNALFKTLPT